MRPGPCAAAAGASTNSEGPIVDLTDAYLLITLATSQAALLGAAAFAASLLPALTVRHLQGEAAAVLLRAFWPVYYRVCAVWATLNALALAVLATSLLPLALAAVLCLGACAAALCFWVPIRMIPTMNRIADAHGPTAAAFDARHRITVLLTGAALLLTLLCLGGIAAILPGHFTVPITY